MAALSGGVLALSLEEASVFFAALVVGWWLLKRGLKKNGVAARDSFGLNSNSSESVGGGNRITPRA